MNFLLELDQKVLWGIPTAVWIKSITIILISLLLKQLLAALATRLYYGFYKKFSNDSHKATFRTLLYKPIQSLIITILVYIAFNGLSHYLEEVIIFKRNFLPAHAKPKDLRTTTVSLTELIDHIFFLAFILYFFLVLARSVRFIFLVWIEEAVQKLDRERQQLLPVLRDLLVVILWAIAFFTVLGVVFHVNVPTLIAGLGFGGVAIAFAAKETLENLLASFMIMVDKPFTIGDQIKYGDIEGIVEKVGFRSTRIRTFDDTLVSVSNQNLIDSNIENLSERGVIRVKKKIQANFELTQEALSELIIVLKNTLNKQSYTNGKATVNIENFTQTIEIAIVYYIKTNSTISTEDIKQQIHLELYKVMNSYGKGFGFPSSISISANNDKNTLTETSRGEL